MKKIFLLAPALAFLFSCNNNETSTTTTSEKQDAMNASGEQYNIDSSSVIIWKASKPTGRHTGIFKIQEGVVTIMDGNIKGGNFIINMASLTNQDLVGDAENKAKLEGHLKSPDFFDVAKYPTSRFEITSMKPYKADSSNTMAGATHIIKGNLTLKDSTKNVSFPAKVTMDSKSLTASGNFDIDRTAWGLNYKGPNNPQDWFISKTVNISLAISASKK